MSDNQTNRSSDKPYKVRICKYCGQTGYVFAGSEQDTAICNPCKYLKNELAYNSELRTKISKMLDDIAKGDWT